MKCKSCSEEISPKFAHSLATNLCPFCGDSILDEELIIVLSELREIMKTTETYKAEVFEWLKTNYNLIDANSDEYKAMIEKASSTPAKIKVDPKDVKMDNKGNQLTGTPLQSQETTNVFLKRAEVKTQDYYKNIAKQINKGTSKNNSTGGFPLTAEDLSEADPAEVEAYAAIISGDSEPVIKSAIDDYDGGEEPLPAIVEAFARGGKGRSGDYNPRDVAKLQALQDKAKGASNELSQSGGVGIIRRG